ncbi:aspartate-semialdehyde dehydrogenase [Pseudomonas sp. NW5]|uniref:aspartate-semialdehyde dehydrogenase n=1 Tax=Pseudomonas sp. NW5 TaxID=2934934 RepID=UPI0020221B49|nr:aspartate-semialdehyde dehydrogenase [Pseudomonas sp. NW5]MCL7461736.1 aspartate-semialdehyde dehydrogenase [Pseudomonas sp. NW5]
MSQTFDIAVLGATHLVGEALLELLEECGFAVGRVLALSFEEEHGQVAPFRGRSLRVQPLSRVDLQGIDLLFALEALTAAQRTAIQAAGCRLIEWPAQSPLPCALAVAAAPLPAAVRSPLPAVIALAEVLAPLQGLLEIRYLHVTAALAAAQRGREGVEELARQTAQLLNARPVEPAVFAQQLAFNLLASSSPEQGGRNQDEQRLVSELAGLPGLAEVPVAVTCLQAPVFFADSLVLSVQCAQPVDLPALAAILEAAPGLEYLDAEPWPSAVEDATGQDLAYVGRLRRGLSDPCQFSLWITADSVRIGAAHAIRLAERLLEAPRD